MSSAFLKIPNLQVMKLLLVIRAKIILLNLQRQNQPTDPNFQSLQQKLSTQQISDKIMKNIKKWKTITKKNGMKNSPDCNIVRIVRKKQIFFVYCVFFGFWEPTCRLYHRENENDK